MKYSIYLLCLAFVIAQCSTDTRIPKEVSILVGQRLAIYAAEQDSLCRAKAIQEAEHAVDSFFISFRKQYLHDSIYVPIKPIKPMIDTHINIDPSTPIRPLWDSLKIK